MHKHACVGACWCGLCVRVSVPLGPSLPSATHKISSSDNACNRIDPGGKSVLSSAGILSLPQQLQIKNATKPGHHERAFGETSTEHYRKTKTKNWRC